MNLVLIEGYEELYSFDLNKNQVYNIKYKKYLKGGLDSKGYYRVGLCKNSKVKYFKLHRLIYEFNIGKIPNGLFIDHIDNNPQNNNLDNLRLANNSENQCNKKNKSKIGYKNIYKTQYNKYRIHIKKNYITAYDKTFETLEEAILNRDINLILIHGKFAKLH